MCVLALGWKAHPKWRLMLAGNRDEFHVRPTAALSRWENPSGIIAGRDLEAGGTWLGISEQGRLAVVTNRRGWDTPPLNPASRGALVTDFLTGAGPHGDADSLDLTRFNPFNLILIDPARARHFTNRPEPTRNDLAPGIYGLSNGGLDEPWPKTAQLKAALNDWLVDGHDDPAPLFSALASRALPDSSVAEHAAPDTPHEPRLSPIFIDDPVYGTRCSTVVLVDTAGEGHIIERRFSSSGALEGETALTFRWPD